ncbi:PLXNA [Mytilus coruscus]|uniref:Hepatocyte growth factor receptor n=1 Tax=Mytilus coruscus TaxID=42192 RepID=A0A6J8DE30_MYTCO|nr:PLXNA [Mytilus coruscus]
MITGESFLGLESNTLPSSEAVLSIFLHQTLKIVTLRNSFFCLRCVFTCDSEFLPVDVKDNNRFNWILYTTFKIVTMFSLPVLALFVLQVTSMKVEKSYRDQHRLQKFVVDKNTGEIYIGGQNTLLKLSSDLSVIQQVNNGPKTDNPLCPPPQIPCNLTKNSINSFTKGLVIDYNRSTLILCSNIYQGSCQVRLLQNIAFIEKDIYKPVVGHNPDSSDVLLIAPGVNKDVLYIGSEYNNINPGGELKVYRDMVPHLSSRDLENLEFSYRDLMGGSKISLLNQYKMDFHVNFLYGFTKGDFVYFIATQVKALDDNTVETKLIRVCQKDKYFHSYVEIPLLCYKDRTQPYTAAKGAFFSETAGNVYVIYEKTGDQSSSSSALCGYKMADISVRFDSTVDECQKGNGNLGPAHLHPKTPCPKSNEPLSLCGEGKNSDQYSSIEGVNPIDEEALIEFMGTSLTSVLADEKTLNNNIFLGTSNGQLKKVIVSSGNQVTVVKEINVDIGQSINELLYSPDKSKVYVLTSNKLLMVDPLHCGERTSCEECSVGQDPVCGWCVMENRCTETEACPMHSVIPHWLMQKSCAKMVEIQPTSLSYEKFQLDEKKSEIQFKLETIMFAPNIDQLDLQCSFVSMTTKSKTKAQIDQNIIKCPLPDELPVVMSGKDYHDVEVEFHIEGRPIVKRSVPVFDCRVHDSCTDCAKSNFSCMWQYQDNTCISTTTNNARQTNGITNADECPRVESPSSVSEIVVHSGETKQIAVRVINLKTEQRDNILCSFQYLAVSMVVPGSISSSSLTCDPVQFNFSATDSPSLIADFKITWGQNNYVLDNPNGISVRIFKCPLLVTNCGQCLSLQPEYECGWCGTYCSLQKHCNATWQDRSAVCQNPLILRFSPSVGPIEGKTNVSISGINLGKTATDIQSGVTVAGVRCTVLPDHYQPSFMFKCETEPSGKAGSGPIKVTVGKIYTAISDNNFTFVEPQVLFLTPREGPRSGGTMITIGGTDLNAGTSVTVNVGGSPCEVDHVSMNTLSCLTSAQTGNDEAEIEVSFGGFKRLMTPKFTYKEDPEIQDVTPKKSILSGGIKIDVMGSRLNIVQKAEFFVEVGNQKITSVCVGKNIGGNFNGIQQLVIRDVKVFVGMTVCGDIVSTDYSLNCTLPAKPKELDSDGNAQVYVEFGNYQKIIGYVSYFEPENGDKPIAMGIILGVVIPIIAIILLLAFCIIKRQRKNGPTKNAIPDMLKDYDTVKEEEDIGLLSVKADLNGQIPNNDSGPYIKELLSRISDEGMKQKISTYLVSRNQLDIGEVVAKGCYGNTYKADYKISEDKDASEVTIKVLQGFPTDTDSVDNFVQHMVTYKDVQHDCLVPYIGVCLGAVDDPILVSYHITCTDLKSHVKDVSKNLTVADLLDISQQIVDGMVYLQDLGLVHGNLAARNCVLTSNNKVKLTDYGYAQLFTAEFYLSENDKRQQIIKWFAPECLDSFQFSTKSDVWSFGIVLWELLTRGVTPYPDVEPNNIRDYLNSGKRLKKPRQCPESLYLLMLQCWTETPNDRPTFQDIQSEMKKFISKEDTNDVTEPLATKIEPGGSSEYLEVVG